MNTADIRNTNKNQGFFWAIAVPLTAGIVFTAVLLAYHGDKLYDAVLQTVHQFKEKQLLRRPSQIESGKSWEKSLPMHSRSWTLRRRSGFGLSRLDSGAIRLR